MTDPEYQNKPEKELFLFEPRTFIIIIIASILTLLIALFGDRGMKFLASVISPVPPHAPFNGTDFPIKQVPNWVKLTEAERKYKFNELPKEKLIPIPSYNPSRLVIPLNSLKWNNKEDDQVRNEKITYSTPYLGTYKLDGIEGTGSHPGIDIKIPEGTPIYAIANGTVIKVDNNSNGGFGNHVIIQHNNFPSFDDANTRATFFSGYAHLSVIAATHHQIVAKGELIGYSGQTGTATTPHLHFQIDTDKAPWHLSWPFSGNDMRAAGLSFFEAINAGLKRENVLLYTINPMKYVQNYFGENTLVASAAPVIEQPKTEQPKIEEQKPSAPETNSGTSTTATATQVTAPEAVAPQAPEIAASMPATTEITTGTSIENTPPPQIVLPVTSVGTTTLPSEFQSPTANLSFSDVLSDSPYFEALTFLKSEGLVAGYGDGSFKPENSVSRAEAITFILRAINEKMRDGTQAVFPDVVLEAWYSKFVTTAYDLGFVKGYPDGYFRPNSTVNLAEFLTMLFVAAKADIDPQISASLPAGVNASDWFAPFVQEALERNLIEVKNNTLDAATPMTRGQIGLILYKLKKRVEASKSE